MFIRPFLAATLMSGLLLAACGEQQKTEREEVGGTAVQFSEPSPAGLPEIKLTSWDSESFALTADPNPKHQELIDLLKKAKEKIDAGLVSGNNLIVTGVSYGVANSKTESCTKIQIQQRSNGKVVVKDELVPASQPPSCSVAPAKGLNFATMAILLKLYNNWAGGIGVGAVAYVEPYIAGCAAGAVGYVLQTGEANGTAGAFCTKIYNTTTGATYKYGSDRKLEAWRKPSCSSSKDSS